MPDKITAFSEVNRAPSPDGWRLMSKLKAGDSLFNIDGEPIKIKDVKKVKTLGIELTMSDGRSYICSEYAKLTERETVSDLIDFLRTRRNCTKRPAMFYKEPPKPALYPKRHLTIPPYLMGLLCSSKTELDSEKIILPELPRQVAIHLIRQIESTPVQIEYKDSRIIIDAPPNKKPWSELMKEYHNDIHFIQQYIHQSYLNGCVVERLELLSGIIDSAGKPLKNFCRVTGLSKTMIMSTLELLYSLGLPALSVPCGHVKIFSANLPTKRVWFQTQLNRMQPQINSDKIRIHKLRNLGYVNSVQLTLEKPEKGFLIENYIPVLT